MALSDPLRKWIIKVVPNFVEAIKRAPTFFNVKTQGLSWGLDEKDVQVLLWPAFQLLQEGNLEKDISLWSRLLFDLFNDKPLILQHLHISSL